MMKTILSIFWLLLLLVWQSVALADNRDKPYVKHLEQYVYAAGNNTKFPGATPVVRKQFDTLWFKQVWPIARIHILSVHKNAENGRAITFLFKVWTENSHERAFTANVMKTGKSRPKYLIVSLTDSSFDIKSYLKNRRIEGYRNFNAYFQDIDPARLDYRNNKGKLPKVKERRIDDKLAVEFLSPDEKDPPKDYAVYRYHYEKNIVAYVLATADCYNTEKSGLSLYLYDTNKIGDDDYRVFNRSQIMFRENDCGDDGDEWHQDGYLIDINHDGYLDMVEESVRGYYDEHTKNGNQTTSKEFWKDIYIGKGKFKTSSITEKEYKALLGK